MKRLTITFAEAKRFVDILIVYALLTPKYQNSQVLMPRKGDSESWNVTEK